MEKNKLTTRELAATGLMTAVICVLGPIALPIPMSPVPVSLGTLAVYLTIEILGMKFATCSCLLYLLIGMVGLPVFTGFSGGMGKLAGPTGGYLIGYIFMALISGFFVNRFSGTGIRERGVQTAGLLLGTVVLYAFGTAWLSHMAGMDFAAALWAGVIPFIPGDLVKILIAILIGPTIRGQLMQQNLLAKE